MPPDGMIEVVNWDRYQHYGKRRPPWIKLYRELLDNMEFAALSDFAVRVLIFVWLIASERDDGLVYDDSKMLAFRIRAPKKQKVERALEELENQGFISRASTALATCKQHASPETETDQRQSESRDTLESASNMLANGEYPLEFEEFWKAYPRKASKGDALKAWGQTAKERPPLDELTLKVANLAASYQWKREGGQFIPYPASWLRAHGWNDEVGTKNAPDDKPLRKEYDVEGDEGFMNIDDVIERQRRAKERADGSST